MENAEHEKMPVCFAWAEGALLGAALAAAVVFRVFHDGSAEYLPGVGLTLTQYVLMGLTLFLKAREGKLDLRGNWQGVMLLVLSLLLGLCYALYFDQDLRVLNFPVVGFTSFLSLVSLCGEKKDVLSPAGLFAGFLKFWQGLFRYLLLPALAVISRVNSKKAGAFLAGLVLCIPVMAVVLSLLSSGDQVFGGWLQAALDGDMELGKGLLHVFVVLAVGLPAFSLLLFCLRDAQEEKSMPAWHLPPASFLALLISMAVAYIAFAGVQVKYLFAGQESVYAQGGYAEYARSGFFQLTWVAFITLLSVGAALTLAQESRGVRALCFAVAALTLVIDFSAFFRMRLYIGQYGLSLLRLLTLWAMAMIALCLLFVMAKSVKTDLRISGVLCAAVLCTWAALNLLNPNLMIAKYNISAYQTGRLPKMDRYYLRSLGPDAKAAWGLIQDEETRTFLEDTWAAETLTSFYDSSVSVWTAKK